MGLLITHMSYHVLFRRLHSKSTALVPHFAQVGAACGLMEAIIEVLAPPRVAIGRAVSIGISIVYSVGLLLLMSGYDVAAPQLSDSAVTALKQTAIFAAVAIVAFVLALMSPFVNVLALFVLVPLVYVVFFFVKLFNAKNETRRALLTLAHLSEEDAAIVAHKYHTVWIASVVVVITTVAMSVIGIAIVLFTTSYPRGDVDPHNIGGKIYAATRFVISVGFNTLLMFLFNESEMKLRLYDNDVGHQEIPIQAKDEDEDDL